ncbi:MAG TPA: AAA family ATPase [Rubrobacteraceae bacterium]|nr:AAA family ATPase [Rubrobacteraceae bacterium]
MLSGIYIKGFKTFARPVRMPLEGGVTAIVGPNGSGKSNITDAVLFALGEQSPGVLRAGAMSELIFSGSETLPPAGAAEVTLVLDNASGEISLPYEEVSITRRISRGGETEYRINGSRARLQDVRAVAGEAGIGRHSILRQGAVDAIVAGGAAACRLALEEAAGLGVYRRRRLSASRRLEKAAAQLEKTRQLEAELSSQLRRLEREAVAAREYRELEARYRELALAHLYRAATRDLEGLQRRLEESEARAAELSAREEALGEEEDLLARRTATLEGRLRETEAALEALEDGAEDLRGESLRADRNLFRLEAGRGGDLRRSAARLEEGLHSISQTLAELEKRRVAAEAEHAALVEGTSRLRLALEEARQRAASAGKERSRLAAEVETLRARLEQAAASPQHEALAREDLECLAHLAESLERPWGEDAASRLTRLRGWLGDELALIEGRAEEADRRRGALAAVVGRAESRVRALQEAAPGGDGTRLYEVIRARPGYEAAVEAGLGEFGAGVLAHSVDEGLRLLSGNERVAVRLDAGRVEEGATPPGKPLVECVEVLDRRYARAVERLLGGIYVVEEPEKDAPSNGYVAVTRQGLRLTRTSLSRRPLSGGFAREAMLEAGLERLDALKNGPGEMLYDLRERISAASRRIERLATTAQGLSTLADRASRARARLARGAARRLTAAEELGRDLAERRRLEEALTLETREKRDALLEAERLWADADGEAAAAARAVAEADEASEDSRRRQRALRSALAEGRDRHARLSRRLEHARNASGRETQLVAQATARAARASSRLAAAVRGRRNALRAARAQTAEAHRAASTERTHLARQAASLAGDLAAARGAAERLSEDLERARAMAAEATEEIEAEWGATLEVARREADRHPPDTAEERARLARRLKRFGDVNLLALSQEEELRERHEFVSAQRADAEAAANELNRMILSVDREIEARFSETFVRVRGAFGEIVPRMMEGASGILDLSEEGVEVGLRLGRRGWKPLRVLSGGERALLALSFLFSIFLSRPGGEVGAFCVLDEAEAALDDLNLARFLAVVDSHRATGQYLLVTHQKRTMAAADVLYGVVQDAAGATTVVSKRMQGE